jgi:hypothetical protein
VHIRVVLTLTRFLTIAAMEPAEINLEAMFPRLDNHRIRDVYHMCGLRDFPSQTRLIEYEGIENVKIWLISYTDADIDTMVGRNSKRTPNNTRVQMGLARTKALKAMSYRVFKKLREGVDCDLHELNQEMIGDLICEIAK